jgi:hypothetical protein
MALCYFAKEGNLRCVSLLLWAGARPNVMIPEDESKADVSDSCALEEAVRAGHLDVLKKLQPDKYPEQLSKLLEWCSSDSAPKMLQYLLTLLPDLSVLSDSGSSILDRPFWRLGWAAEPKQHLGTRDTQKIGAIIDSIELLVKHGAKWKPEAESASSACRYFRHLEPSRILRVFTILKEHQAAEIAFLESLVATPTMRAHLGDASKKITHLFHPPPAKPAEPAVAKPEPPSEPPKASIAELKTRAEEFLLGLIRKTPAFDFWKTELWEWLETKQVRGALGMSKEDDRSWSEIFESAIEKINKSSRSFKISLVQRRYLTVTLLKGKEWHDVSREVSISSDLDNPRRVTESALKLLSWVKEHGSPNDWVKESTLSWHAGFRGRLDRVGDYIKELRRKLGSVFCYEVRGQRWSQENPIEYKVWLAGDVSVSDPLPKKSIPGHLNPVLKGSLDHYTKDNLDAWRDFIHNHLLNSQPTGTDPIHLLWIDNRGELERAFPSFPFGRNSDGDKIAKFVSEIRVHPEIKIVYDFRSESDVWFARLVPAKSWEVTLQGLRELRAQPTLEVRYGISRDAAKLLEWIEGLRDKDYLGKWTPTVEEQLEKKIGIKCPWDNANLPAYLTELLTELNDRTPCESTLQPWKCYSEQKHRIRVSQKKSNEAVVIQQIQLLALKQGKTVPADRIREFITQLLE